MEDEQSETILFVLTVVCNEHTGGEATCKSKAVCEVCGTEYGDIDSTNHVGETEIRDAKEATSTATGYTGDTYCLDCETKIASGEVTKLQSEISYTGGEYSSTFDYTGAVQSAIIDQLAVSIMDTNGNVLIESPVLTTDYTIVYKIDGVEKEPILPGTYSVYLKASATEFWTESEVAIGTITISPYEPTINFIPMKFEYTQGIDSITASGTIELEVVGAEGGINPKGTVTVVAKDNETTEVTIASDIPLENGSTTITFSNVEPEKLYCFSFSYTPISEAPYTDASGNYEAKYVTIGSGESTNYTLNGVTKDQLYFVVGQEITVNAGTKDGYSFKEWSINSEKEIVMSEGNINTSSVKFTMPNGDVSLTASWNQLSSDTSLQSVSVSGVTGEINGDTINVVLPYTTEVLPKNTEDISIALTDNCASVKDLKIENEGETWTFIVEAEDKTTQQYTINVSIADIPVYTVIYTDGLADVEIFPDQKYEVEVGTATPPFDETDVTFIHPEYEFMGWDSDISDTVLENVTYKAVLKKHTWNTSWTNDDTHHWHKCDNTDCPITENSQKNGYGVHTGGTATCKSLAVCEVCNVSYGTKDSTNHEGGTELRNEKEATTTATGYTGDTHCLGCGEKIASGKEIPIITSIPMPEPEEPTVTPEPVTPKPTATSTPKPTATSTPTPKPTATSTPTPKPTATSTPTPTATSTPTPKPTATSTPKPTTTNTPKPTATSTPTPTATSTLKPTTRPIIIIPSKPKVTVTPTPTEVVTPSVTPEATVTEKPLVKPTIKPRPVIIPSKPKVTVTPTPTETIIPSVTVTPTEKPLVNPTIKPKPVIIPSKPKVTVTPKPTEVVTPSMTPEATVTEKPLVNPTTKPRPVIIPIIPKVTVTPKPMEIITPSVTEIPEVIIIPSITPELPKDENVSEQEKEDAFGYTMNIGEIIQLSFPSMEIGRKGYQWTSSNETVAVVNNGMVTARSAGEVTISLQSYNKKTKEYITIASIKLRVLDK